MVVKVADFLLQAISRVIHKSENEDYDKLKEVTDWYDFLVDVISEEVSRVGYSGIEECFFRHYVLCYLQCEVATIVSEKSSINYFYKDGEPYVKNGEEKLYLSEVINSRIDGDEKFCNSVIFRFLDDAVSLSGISLEEVKGSVARIVKNEILCLEEIPLYFSIDMVISEYVFENPECFIESLLYGSGKNYLNTDKGGGKYDEKWFFIFIRVALYREFVDIVKHSVFAMDKSSRSPFERMEEVSFFSQNGYGDEVKFDGSREFYSISKSELGSKFYRERVSHLMNDVKCSENKNLYFLSSFNYYDLPFLLSYATKNHTLFFFKNKVKGKVMRADKVFSICSGFYVLLFKKLLYEDVPIVGEFDENEDDSVSKRASIFLKKKHDVVFKPRTVYRSYLEGNKNYFKVMYDMWNKFLTDKTLEDMSCWQVVQVKASNFEFMD